MVKNYNREKLEQEGILEFEDTVYMNESSSFAWVSPSFKALKEMGVKKGDAVKVTIQKASKNDQ